MSNSENPQNRRARLRFEGKTNQPAYERLRGSRNRERDLAFAEIFGGLKSI